MLLVECKRFLRSYSRILIDRDSNFSRSEGRRKGIVSMINDSSAAYADLGSRSSASQRALVIIEPKRLIKKQD